jgi:hypothetical protein
MSLEKSNIMFMKKNMTSLAAILIALIFFVCCGQDSNRQKQLELKEKELALKEKELELKEKKLSIDSAQKSYQNKNLNYLIKYTGKHTWETDIFETQPLHSRLKNLTGIYYENFIANIAVQAPMEIKEQIFFVRGCYPHSCGYDESAFSIDIKNDAIFIAILSSGKLLTFYENEKIPLPSVFRDYIYSHQDEQNGDYSINSKYGTIGTIQSLDFQGNNYLDIQILTSSNTTVGIWCTEGTTRVYKNNNHAFWTDLKVGVKIGIGESKLFKNEDGKSYIQGVTQIDILQ